MFSQVEKHISNIMYDKHTIEKDNKWLYTYVCIYA